MSISWCWKLAGLPPLQWLAATSVDGNLVGEMSDLKERIRRFIVFKAFQPSDIMIILQSYLGTGESVVPAIRKPPGDEENLNV